LDQPENLQAAARAATGRGEDHPMRVIHVAGTADTKAGEMAYLRDLIAKKIC
jgi:hypothetical protein